MDMIATETPRRRPRFSRVTAPAAFQITERDIEILRQVARSRFLRSTHISQLLEASHKKILGRLTLLYHAGYLDRPRSQLEYHVRGGGGAPLVYALGNAGARLLSHQEDHQENIINWGHKNRESGREFIRHALAVADVRVALTLTCRAIGSVALQEPDDLVPTLPPETRAARNPWAWRARVQHNGVLQDIGILPDYVFALMFPDGKRRAFLVECDRGTMPMERSTLDQTSMLRKFLAYESARVQRLHTGRFSWKTFRVLIVTVSPDRAANMRALIERTPALQGSPLFLFANHEAIKSSNILLHLWSDARGNAHSLV